MRFRKPTFLTSLVALIALAVMIGLGVWQLDRREWKNELLAEVADRMDQPPVPLPAVLNDGWEFRRVSVTGSVVPDSWFRFPGRAVDGEVRDLLMLLVRLDDGRVVAMEYTDVGFGDPFPPMPIAVAADGILRTPQQPGWFTSANNVSANQWYWVELDTMYAAAGVTSGGILDFYLKPSDWRPNLPANHLEYALTWFSLAGIFLVIFIVFHRQRPDIAR